MATKISRSRKIFSKSAWGLSSIFFGILFGVFAVASVIAPASSNFINEFFHINPYERVETGEGKIFDEYKSDFLNEDGSFDNTAMRKNSEEVALQTATEGSVLLWNKDNTLPLKKDSKVSYLGISSVKYLFSSAGSGHLGVTSSTSLNDASAKDGLVPNPKIASAYKFLSSQYGNYMTSLGQTLSGASSGDKCYIEYGINEAPYSELNSTQAGDVTSSLSDYGDCAVLVLSRNDGEDGDTNYATSECLDNNYLDLATRESEILTELEKLKAAGSISRIAVVLNSAQPFQMKHLLTRDIDACFWAGVGGNVSFSQIADLISGKSNFSGRLIDTYCYENDSAPSTVNQGDFTFAHSTGLPATTDYSHSDKYVAYAESIYVGYRYYETRYEDCVLAQGGATAAVGASGGATRWDYAKEVAYPFGYGLSYTSFEHSDVSFTKTSDGYNASVKVTNTGSVAGKEVAQIYLQKPYTAYDQTNVIEKSAVELAGFAKSSLLAPGASEKLTIAIKSEDFKSYDAYNKKTYILEAGDYYLAEGNNAHDALNNILAAKGKGVADGMDRSGEASHVEKIVIDHDDTKKYATSLATDYPITNQFSAADVKLYEGLKGQFDQFRYLSRSDWAATYPVAPVSMDATSTIMIDDLQYTHDIVEDPAASMPTYGKKGSQKLMAMWGLDYDDEGWNEILDQLTWEEMNNLATMGGGLAGAESCDAPAGSAKDGPAGIGVGNPTMMCFPSECNMAATFNVDLVEELGNAFGMEILHVGYVGIYGPGANIHRSAYSGRNWEYYSEDPYISGKMLAHEVTGLQHRGVIVFTKHFLLNDQERNRYGVSVFANEQSIRELYLRSFEGGVREGQMNGLMSSFNRIGCVWSGKHAGLLTEVLRKEWGFLGVVQTDAYVGTHMHMAIAESLIAGNDFTMGGAVSNKFDAWKNSPTLVSALRETAHRILYTKLHSSTMNGMSISTVVIYHTPWWETTLEVGKVSALVLTVISVTMLALSFALPFLWKKRDALLVSPENKDGKIRYFFDVISKKATIVCSSVLVTLIAVGGLTPVVVQNIQAAKQQTTYSQHVCHHVCPTCGKCQDYNCHYVACQEKCTCPCDHACAICGKCVDYDSTEPRCKEKCGAALTKSFDFEAEDSHVLLYGGDLGNLGIARETAYGATESYVGGFNANLSAKIKYVLNVASATRATLFASVCKRNGAQLFTNNVIVTVNGEIVESRGVVPAVVPDVDHEWTSFYSVCLGCVELKEGRNAIDFIVANDDVGCGFNFNKITLKSDVDIAFYEGEHICDDVCPICGLCTNEKCTDPVCADKCTCSLNKLTFGAADSLAERQGGTLTDGRFYFNQAGDSIRYSIKAEKASTPVLFLDLAKDTSVRKITDLYDIQVNNTSLVSEALTSNEGESIVRVKIGKLAFDYGKNTISIVSKASTSPALANLVLGSKESLVDADPREFGVDSSTVLVSGNAYKDASNHLINMAVNGASGSEITFQLDSDRASTADLYAELGCRSGIIHVQDILQISCNDTVIATDALLSNEGSDLLSFAKLKIGQVSLLEGKNILKFRTLLAEANVNTTLRTVSFQSTEAKLCYSAQAATMCRLLYEAEAAKLNLYDKYPYVSSGQNAHGGQFLGGVNDAGVYASGQASIELTISAEKDCQSKISVCAGISGNAKANCLSLVVDNLAVSSDQTWAGGGWYDWQEYFHSNIALSQGEHTLRFIIQDGACLNLDYFVLESTVTLTQIG